MVYYSLERITDLVEELSELFPLHDKEAKIYDDLVLDFDWDVYSSLQDAGAYFMFTVRDSDTGKLNGYLGYLVGPSPFYKGETYAKMDLFYLQDDLRGSSVSAELLEFAEASLLSEQDVTIITASLPSSKPLRKTLGSLGYLEKEITFTKYIGDERWQQQ